MKEAQQLQEAASVYKLEPEEQVRAWFQAIEPRGEHGGEAGGVRLGQGPLSLMGSSNEPADIAPWSVPDLAAWRPRMPVASRCWVGARGVAHGSSQSLPPPSPKSYSYSLF